MARDNGAPESFASRGEGSDPHPNGAQDALQSAKERPAMRTAGSSPNHVVALALALAVIAVAVPAHAQTVTLTAQLTGAEENPLVGTGAHGKATVTIDRAAQQITYRVEVYTLPSGITASHIHAGPIGFNGPIIFDFVSSVTQTVSNDFAISGTLTAANLIPRPAVGVSSFEDAIMTIASGAAYVNVHSQVNPGGEIRGQLCPDSPSANLFNGVATCIAKK
jgi:hypothetical protein